jgi:hypothetical protein
VLQNVYYTRIPDVKIPTDRYPAFWVLCIIWNQIVNKTVWLQFWNVSVWLPTSTANWVSPNKNFAWKPKNLQFVEWKGASSNRNQNNQNFGMAKGGSADRGCPVQRAQRVARGGGEGLTWRPDVRRGRKRGFGLGPCLPTVFLHWRSENASAAPKSILARPPLRGCATRPHRGAAEPRRRATRQTLKFYCVK